MEILSTLADQIQALQIEINAQNRIISSEKTKILHLESLLIENKEKLRTLVEAEYKLLLSSDFDSIRDIARDREVARLQKKHRKERQDDGKVHDSREDERTTQSR